MRIRGLRNHHLNLPGPTSWLVVLCALTVSIQAATITVTNLNDDGSGSLRQALASASDGDTIAFTVTGSILLTSGELLVDKSVAITGPGAPNLAVDGNAKSRVFHIAPDRDVSINGLTIANGNPSGDVLQSKGGGIYNDEAALTVDSCTVTGNSAANGGGIYNSSMFGLAILEISNSVIYGNTATITGGGIRNDSNLSASLTISDSTLVDNSAPFGGGIYNISGDFSASAILTVNNAAFSGNSADSGGCIYNVGALGIASLTLNDRYFKR